MTMHENTCDYDDNHRRLAGAMRTINIIDRKPI